MRMSAADQKTYPKMASYVRNKIPGVIFVTPIVDAFRKVGGINRSTLKQALLWDKGPQIKITPLVGAYGAFTPNIKSNEIRVNTQLAKDFEAGTDRRVTRAGNVYLLGVTLLHELVHWADDQDGIDRPGEEGEEFEKMMYGKVIS